MPDETRKQLTVALASFLRDIKQLPANSAVMPEIVAPLLIRHGLIDTEYYKDRYQDVAASGIHPAWHYARFGFLENRIPAAMFENLDQQELSPDNLGKTLKAHMQNILSALDRKNDSCLLRQGSTEALQGLPLYVHWSITARCNYRCSYCSHFYGKDGKLPPEPELGQLLAAADKLIALNRPAYQFVLLGGEPTVCPHLPYLIDYLDHKLGDRFKQLVLVTNGSRSVEYFNQFAPLSERVYIQIMHSIHLEFEDPDRLYHLISNLHPKIDLNLLLMAHPEKMELAKEIFEKLCILRFKAPFHLFIQPIYRLPDFTMPDARYANDFFAWREKSQHLYLQLDNLSPVKRFEFRSLFNNFFWEFYENGRIIRNAAEERGYNADRGWLNFQGKYCVGGAHLIRIHEDGQVMGTTCGLLPSGLNIYQHDLDEKKYMGVLRCPKTFCACSDNDLLMKFSNPAEAHAFLDLARCAQSRLKKNGTGAPNSVQ